MSLVRLVVSVVSLLITASGCVLIRVPATAVETSRTGEISATSDVTVLSVVFSPDLSLRASGSLGERMVECVEIVKPPRDEPWGMREFDVRTVDGHRLMLGSSLTPDA